MARARNIKPAFFENEILSECEPLARLLFIGLWTLADREGKLEDRPKRIKGQIFPYDDCNAEKLLQQLNEREFIMRYEYEGKKYIWIPAFTRHQNPHINEAPKGLPDPAGVEVYKLPYVVKGKRKDATEVTSLPEYKSKYSPF